MGKADDLLKDMIRFQGKRVAKEVLGDLPAQMKQARRDIRSIQKSVTALARKVDELLEKAWTEAPVPPASEDEVEKARFTKRTLPAIRKRLDLTQLELAKLLGVALNTVNSWERGNRQPKANSIAKIIALRSMTQQQVDEALGRKPAPAAMDPKAIKDLRVKLGLSQGELAQLVGVSSATVGSWEQSRSVPGTSNREALIQVRGLSQEDVDERLGLTAAGRAEGKAVLSPAHILEIRKNAGLSQGGMARAIGASVNSVCNWEKGHARPRAKFVGELLAMRKQPTAGG